MPALDPATHFSITNALALARASQSAYGPGASARSFASVMLGLTGFEFFDKEDTQAYVAWSDRTTVVAFRGTESIRDWMYNARTKLVDTPVGRVHQGFHTALNAVWSRLGPLVQSQLEQKKAVWLCGHSLGGALATLAAARLLQEGLHPSGLYTYGQPRVGDRSGFARKFNQHFRARAFRFVNNNDLVPRVPPRSMGYWHIGRSRYIDASDRLHLSIRRWRRYLDALQGMAQKAAHPSKQKAIRRLDELVLEAGRDWIEDHDIKAYITKIQKIAAHPAQIVAA
jgi:triacylglycerol lipase